MFVTTKKKNKTNNKNQDRFNISQIHSASVQAVPRSVRHLTKASLSPEHSAKMRSILKRVDAW
jgi:hypothetical protein